MAERKFNSLIEEEIAVRRRLAIISFSEERREIHAREVAHTTGEPATFLDQRRQRWVVESLNGPAMLDGEPIQKYLSSGQE